MLETAGPPPAGLRAALRVGGIDLGRHQLSLALAMGCERIVCIARGLDRELVEVQHAAEQAGARFHLITAAQALISLVTAADEVVILADGLLVAPEQAAALLELAPAVLVQPIEIGLPLGFERIDLNHSAAGAMRIPGRLVERLADLPADCDAVSALQRIALQGGVAQSELPSRLRESGAWRLVRDEAEAQAAEGEWIKRMTAPKAGDSPTQIGVRGVVRAFGPALLHSGSGGIGLRWSAILVLLLALGAAWSEWPTAAFVMAILAWLLRGASGLLRDIEREVLHERVEVTWQEDAFAWLVDLVFVLTIAWNLTGAPPEAGFLMRAFPAVMLVLLLRLVPTALGEPWAGWFGDRGLVGLVLVMIAIGGLRAAAVEGLALGLALLGVIWPVAPFRLTRT